MRIRIAIAVAVLAAAASSCRRHHAEALTTSSDATTSAATVSQPALTGQTHVAEARSSTRVDHSPDVGSDPPTPGAIINVPALVGRSREKVEGVLGEPTTPKGSVYSVSGQTVTVKYDRGRAIWFSMHVPWPVYNAVDALRVLSVDVLNVTPKKESEEKAEYELDLSGPVADEYKDVKLEAQAAKTAADAEWTSVAAGIHPPPRTDSNGDE